MKINSFNILSKSIILSLIVSAILASCNLEQEIEIELPQYEPQSVVECYLEEGKPFRLALSRSFSYFDTFGQLNTEYLKKLLLDSARVTIEHNGKTYTLNNTIFFDPISQKFANYVSNELVPADYEHEFKLNIVTKAGETITGTTKLLPKIPIDSIVVQFPKDDTLARVLTYFTDDPSKSNFYRRVFQENSLDSLPKQDFVNDDKLYDTPKVAFGTGYNFAKGDTVINTLYHITEDYFLYYRSVNLAIVGNGSPAGQPSTIKSNVKGNKNPLGIFTGLSFDRKITVIQ